MNSVEQFAAGVGTEVAEAADTPRLSLLVPPADKVAKADKEEREIQEAFLVFPCLVPSLDLCRRAGAG